MAVERRDPTAGRSLASVPRVPSAVVRPPSARSAARPPSASAASPRAPFLALVLGPAILSLAITLLRLLGEVLRWSPEYYNRLPGGGLSPLGITWLVPVFGFYFGWRLQRLGLRPWSVVQAALQPALSLLLAGGAAWLVERLRRAADLPRFDWTSALVLWATASGVALLLSFAAWPALGSRLLVYAYLARIPVAAVMGLSMLFGWETHYDAVPPRFPWMAPWTRWFWLALPQFTIWIAFTVGVGMTFGALGWLAADWRARSREA